MSKPSSSSAAAPSSVAAAASEPPPAGGDSERKTWSTVDRHDRKYRHWCRDICISLGFSIVCFCMTVGLSLAAFLLWRKNYTMARASLDSAHMWILFFVLNTPHHLFVYGWSLRPPPKPQATAHG